MLSDPTEVPHAPRMLSKSQTLNHYPPQVVVSLDFELRWGMHDIYGFDFDAYRGNLEGVRQAVPALLDALAAHRIRATWATVGALACSGWDDYFQRAPRPPQYADSALAIKPRYAELDPGGALHFAPDLVRAILTTPGQDFGTHTFSHLYLREPGITADDVAADLAAAFRLYSEQYNVVPRSLVFPRNQPAFIEVVRASKIRIWRGNPRAWYYECEDSQHNGPVPRALKLVDSVTPLNRLAAPLEDDMTRASIFLRLSLPSSLWALHTWRIRRELEGMQPGDIFHIWFHPHNLGQDLKLRLSRVKQVLELVADKQQQGRLVSCSMADLVH